MASAGVPGDKTAQLGLQPGVQLAQVILSMGASSSVPLPRKGVEVGQTDFSVSDRDPFSAPPPKRDRRIREVLRTRSET